MNKMECYSLNWKFERVYTVSLSRFAGWWWLQWENVAVVTVWHVLLTTALTYHTESRKTVSTGQCDTIL